MVVWSGLVLCCRGVRLQGKQLTLWHNLMRWVHLAGEGALGSAAAAFVRESETETFELNFGCKVSC